MAAECLLAKINLWQRKQHLANQMPAHFDLRILKTNLLSGLYPKCLMIVLGFNDMSTLVGHFVSSPREREKRDRRDSRGDERED